MGAHMGSMNISIRREVYDELQRRKSPGESFSDVLERLLQRPSLPSDFAGMLGEEGASRLREVLDRNRRSWTKAGASRRER
jgi:predicted CopG family antitoxin